MYTTDGAQLLWKGKPARLAKGATGRRLSDTMASDGRTLYFAQQRVPVPEALRLETLRVRVFDENPVNLTGAVLDDGDAVWQLTRRGPDEVRPLPGADFATVERMSAPGLRFDHHVRDRNGVWYRGAPVIGLEADRARVVGEHIVTDGERLWLFGRMASDLTAADLTWVWSSGRVDLVRTDDALLRLDADTGGRVELARTSGPVNADDIATRALQAIGHDLAGVFDTHPPIVVPVADIAWDRVEARPVEPFVARFDGASIVLEADGIEPIRAEADGWYGALCTLWLRRRGLPGCLVSHPSLGTMLPDGEELQHRLIARHRDLFLQYCGAAFARGAHEGARLSLRRYTEARRFGCETPFDGQDAIVATLPRGLFEDIAYEARRFGFRSTTNLSAARHAIASGLLDDADPRVRLEMLGLVHGTVLESRKLPLFLRHVLPAILTRLEVEPLAALREQLHLVLEAFIIRAFVQAEVHHEPTAELVEPLLHRQVADGVNVLINRARLIEVLLHRGEEGAAADAIAAFTREFGADCGLPGVYVHRPWHDTVDDAVQAMRERAAALVRTAPGRSRAR